MKNGFLLFSGILAVLASGCSQVKMMQAQPVCMSVSDQGKLMQVCEKILAGMQFGIEKYDEENGVIRTRPLRSKQFFEFWRSDNASGFDCAESNIQSLHRTAELTFETRDLQVCVTCVVETKRLSMPEKAVSGYYGASALYTASGPSRQRLEVKEQQLKEMHWIDMGRDEALEQKILEKIQRKVNRGIK